MATAAHDVRVVDVTDLTPRMRRVTVEGPSLRGLATTPAQEVGLALLDAHGSPVRRRYTIRSARPQIGQWDIDVVLHGHGPGAAWGESVRVGDALSFAGPRGTLVLPPAQRHLMFADEAGLPAVAALAEAAPIGQQVTAIIEVADAAEQQPLHSLAALDVRWLRRDGLPAGRPDPMRRAIERLEFDPAHTAAVILAESKAGIAVRDALMERGIAKSAIQVKGYWNIGRERPRSAAIEALGAAAT